MHCLCYVEDLQLVAVNQQRQRTQVVRLAAWRKRTLNLNTNITKSKIRKNRTLLAVQLLQAKPINKLVRHNSQIPTSKFKTIILNHLITMPKFNALVMFQLTSRNIPLTPQMDTRWHNGTMMVIMMVIQMFSTRL